MANNSLTPFLFTSEKELNKTYNKWYVMWINPETFSFNFQTNQTEHLTKGGYGWFHWQNRLPRISFSGISGWVYAEGVNGSTLLQRLANAGSLGKMGDLLIDDFSPISSQQGIGIVDGFRDTASAAKSLASEGKRAGALKKGFLGTMDNLKKIGRGFETPKTVEKNDARTFVTRLQRIALQDMYYNNYFTGYKKYNKKYIYIYTKRYPEGKKIEGFFTNFNIPEKADDAQLIRYRADFVVEKGLEDEELNPNTFKNFLNVVENTAQLVGSAIGVGIASFRQIKTWLGK